MVTNPRKLSAEHGISHVTFEAAIGIEKAVREALGAGPALMPTGVHPYAMILPAIEGEEFDALVEDIAMYGLNQPITLLDDLILDGRNRALACEKAGVAPHYVLYTGEDPLAFVLSQNIKRRHLDESQRSGIAAKVLQICKVSQPKAAELLNVSPRSVASALKVREKAAPEVFEAVMTGKVAVSRAAEIADLPYEDQRDLVREMSPPDIVRNHERIKKNNKRDETFKRINEQASASPAWPEGRYSVIYADPPTEDDFGHTKRDVEHHYPTMSWDDLKALPVEEIATDDAVLYLWASPHMVHKMLEVMARWGFDYRAHMVWMKDTARAWPVVPQPARGAVVRAPGRVSAAAGGCA